jgi:sucrose-6-phosphate hydrolase SacC (GH32 family)
VMRIRPIRELESLRYDETQQENLALKKDVPMLLDGIRGDHMELKLEITDTGDQDFGVDVLCDEQGQSGLRIRINREQNLLDVGEENGDFTLASGEPLTLRIFIDGTLVEVFAIERHVVMNDKKRAVGEPINDGVAVFSVGSDLNMDRITAWQMKSAYPTE